MSIGLRHALSFGTIAAIVIGCASVSPAPTTPVTKAALLGSWDLIEVGSRSVSKGMTLTFNPDGSLGGSVRCNSLSGRYELLPQRIVFSEAIITAAGCISRPDNRAIVQRAEKTLFSPAAVAFLSGNGARLYVRGRDTLEFRRAASEPPFMARVSQRWLDELAAAGVEVVSLTALLRSTVEVRDGCVVAGVDNPRLLIFPPTSRLVMRNGAWAVHNDVSRKTVPFGSAIEVGGGGGDALPTNLERDVPARCRFGRHFTLNSGLR